MLNANVKQIITRKPNTWEKTNGSFPEIIRSSDHSIVFAEYVELPSGELMIIEYEIPPDNAELMQKVEAFKREEAAFLKELNNTEDSKTPEADQTAPAISQANQKKDSSIPESKPKTIANSARKKKSFNKLLILIPAAIIICALLTILVVPAILKQKSEQTSDTASITENLTQEAAYDVTAATTEVFAELDEEIPATSTDSLEEEIVEEFVDPFPFNPHCVESTKPENMIQSTAVCVDGEILENISDYKATEEISFGLGEDYTDVEGIITFRGNNFRNEPTYGHANLKEYKFESLWTAQTGSLTFGEDSWTGSGWTGQPLIVKWPAEVKKHMNMYDSAKENDNLVEVIYACLDGNIYFLDLETGEKTRDTLNVGFTFKGSGALDPRGYPIMYVGAGFDSVNGPARVFIINLLDCSIMHTFGNGDPFTTRGNLSYFDSSPLVDAETDTLIYPGENGVLYFVKLGTNYNEKTGKLSINPEHVVKWHYMGKRSSGSSYWTGMEDSAVIYKGYLYIMDNGGHFMCLDINTLQLVWVQDSLDDSNSTPVLSVEDGKAYLYASTSFRLGWRSTGVATIPIWKIDAETGEILWATEYRCYSEQGVSGGVQSTIAVGRDALKDYIYVTVAKTEGDYSGLMACINKETGEVAWQHPSSYTWSSPVCVYDENGLGAVLYCNSAGRMFLLNGLTGDSYDAIALGKRCIEASPAIYNSTLVIGTRGCQIWGVRLK